MKNFKNLLHILLTFASLFGFLGGWATLAHSRKPVQPVSAGTSSLEPLPALAPLPSMNINNQASNNNSGINIIVPSQAPLRRSRSVFQSSGS